MDKIDEILEFWFGKLTRDDELQPARQKRWFQKQPAFDRAVAQRFGKDVQEAGAGRLDDWLASARGSLALVILLDQFTRNIHRNLPQAYAFDARARAATLGALARGLERELRPIERLFLFMPLMHAEDRALQERSAELFAQTAATAPALLKETCTGFAASARRHADVVGRFGRFPHRNALLGRTSTPDEMEFLSTPGAGF